MSSNKVVVSFLMHGGLAVVRSLGKRGVDVIGVTFGDDEFGQASRYIKE
jgi:hypothetical protein